MPLYWITIGFFVFYASFALFFHYRSKFSSLESKVFTNKLFKLSFTTNIIVVILLYILFYLYNGTAFEPEAADSLVYQEHGVDLSKRFKAGNFNISGYLSDSDYSDFGYNVFLGITYSLFGTNPLTGRFLNALLGAFMVVTIYKTSKVLTNDSIAKTSSLLLTFAPFSLFYIGVTMKETLMIFILIQATYYGIKINNPSISKKTDALSLGIYTILLFFFRTPLAMAFISSLFIYIYLGLKNKKSVFKFLTILSMILSFALIVFFVSKLGLSSKMSEIIDQSSSQYDAELNEKIKSGGKFGLSIDKAAIVPFITISVLAAPFSTFTLVDNQDLIAWLLPACLSKNLLIFFALFGIWYSIKKQLRSHSIILAITFSYQIILAVSAVSTSGRYQLVTLPFLCIFMGIGLHEFKPNNKNAWLIFLFLMLLIIVGWNYFKLSIRQLEL
jgi:hypothetical protein